jgi:serine O-acetyltransferase
MHSSWEYLTFVLNFIRCIPHLILYYKHKNKSLIQADVEQGFKLMGKESSFNHLFGIIYLLAFCRQFRNLFYYRIRPYSTLLNIICPQMPNLEITAKNIGGGFTIIHGFATAVGAESIGNNCSVYQQVTIGGTIHGAPKLLDNVIVSAGAVIIGNITIGNNVVIGANATVFRDVPDNCTVLPGSTKIMRWKTLK